MERWCRLAARTVMLASGMVVLAAMAQDMGGMAEVERLRRLYAGPVATWPAPVLDPRGTFAEFAAVPPIPSVDAKRAAIGRRLFDDPRLSRSGQIACASCHLRELGFSNGIALAFGHDRTRGRRNVQSLLTVAWTRPLFWDGRVATLEEQALMPVLDGTEMAATLPLVLRRLNADPAYRTAFAEAGHKGRITARAVAGALAAFERTLRPPRTRYDRALTEGAKALDDRQLLGLHLFRTKAGCAACHSGPLLTDGQFHDLGISFYGRPREDLGRWNVTHAADDVGRFRTPSLRALTRTGPYMHNGVLRTLPNVVAFYNGGGGAGAGRLRVRSSTSGAPAPVRDPLLRPLKLTRTEQEALVAFLETL